MHKCPLCGYKFQVAALACATNCPLATRCHSLCCPHCHYHFADVNESAVVRAMNSMLRIIRRQHEPVETHE